ncbi:MAG: hypothetical protein ACRC3B_20105 [Bacteroidia bacterium]
MAHQKPRKNELRKEIAALIDSIKNQSDRIGTNREVPQVDIDVIIHSIEQLHRKAVVFSYLNSISETEETETPVVVTLPVAPVVPVVEIPAVVAEVKAPEVVIPEPPKVEAPAAVPVPEVKAPEPAPIAPAAVPEPPKVEVAAPPVPEVKAPEPAPIAPVAAPEPPRTEPAPQPQAVKPSQPAAGKDVRGMIGFNEKLMFMRSLFGGDASAYDEALNHLNGTASRDEADAFVSMLQREYRWQPESEPAEMFRNLVNRRFS